MEGQEIYGWSGDLRKRIKVVCVEEKITICTNGKNYFRISIANFSKICRCCLFGGGEINLFECKHEEMTLGQIYSSVFSIRISEQDGLPQNICQKCTKDIIDLHTRLQAFKLSVLDSETILKNLFTKNVDEINNINTEKVKNDDIKLESNFEEEYHHLEEEKPSTYQCKFCKETFKAYILYVTHEKIESRKKVACSSCKKMVTRMFMQRHRIKYCKGPFDPSALFQCHICGKSYKSKRNLGVHNFEHTKMPHSCEDCGKGFRSPCRLKEHMNIHRGIKPFPCDKCSERYYSKRGLQQHLERIHEGKKRKVYVYPKKHKLKPKRKSEKGAFPCEICGKVYATRYIVRDHLLTHNEEKTFQCNDCGEMFANKGILSTHNRKHRLPYRCTICTSSFAYANSLETHMNSHTGEKPHACTMCDKRYSNRSHLKDHILTHTGERPHLCSICGKSFAVKTILRNHYKIHEKERRKNEPSINVVDKSQSQFKKKSHPKQPVLTQMSERPHLCSICGKSFAVKPNLRKHYKIHEKEKRNKPISREVNKEQSQ